MDLIEILFIAFFFLVLPLLDGIQKRRRKGQMPAPGEREAGPEERSESAREDQRPAAEMLPDDLWEVMTGQRRQSPGDEGGAPWSGAPGEGSAGRAPTETQPDWELEPWRVDEEAEVPEPESLEYRGPEAYSLETPAPEPVERTVPSAEARHRAFHELIDRRPARRDRVTSPLLRALRSRDGLRQAVVLKEILGPPKGLE